MNEIYIGLTVSMLINIVLVAFNNYLLFAILLNQNKRSQK